MEKDLNNPVDEVQVIIMRDWIKRNQDKIVVSETVEQRKERRRALFDQIVATTKSF